MAEVLLNFKTLLILGMGLAVMVNRRSPALFVLSLAVLAHHLLAFVVYNTIYNLGSAKTTWNVSWVLFELPLCLFLYTKIILNFKPRYKILGGATKRDVQVLLLSFLYILSHLVEFVDWNNGDIFMAKVMPYVTPTINLLIVISILQDWLTKKFERIFNWFKDKQYSLKALKEKSSDI